MCLNESMKLCRTAGISRQESNLLISLEPGEYFTCNEVAKKMDLSPSRVSRIVDKLIIKGYLDRKTSSSDRRSIVLSLTNSGKKCREQVENGKEQCEKRLRQHLNEKELNAVHGAIEILIKAVGGDNGR